MDRLNLNFVNPRFEVVKRSLTYFGFFSLSYGLGTPHLPYADYQHGNYSERQGPAKSWLS